MLVTGPVSPSVLQGSNLGQLDIGSAQLQQLIEAGGAPSHTSIFASHSACYLTDEASMSNRER